MTVLITNQRERNRFLKFLVVGVFGAIVDFGTFNLLTHVFYITAVLASMLSFVAAIVNNFLWNRFWTYPDSRSKSTTRQLIEFSLISGIGLAIRTPIFATLEFPLEKAFNALNMSLIDKLGADFLGHNFALAIAVIVVMFWNFFINRYWTYSDVGIGT
ncbi:MAG: GtrA family protein [Anaerolineales bacterium]|nr:MAG: GtrA family protein [Anaerolineales bacterium]